MSSLRAPDVKRFRLALRVGRGRHRDGQDDAALMVARERLVRILHTVRLDAPTDAARPFIDERLSGY